MSARTGAPAGPGGFGRPCLSFPLRNAFHLRLWTRPRSWARRVDNRPGPRGGRAGGGPHALAAPAPPSPPRSPPVAGPHRRRRLAPGPVWYRLDDASDVLRVEQRAKVAATPEKGRGLLPGALLPRLGCLARRAQGPQLVEGRRLPFPPLRGRLPDASRRRGLHWYPSTSGPCPSPADACTPRDAEAVRPGRPGSPAAGAVTGPRAATLACPSGPEGHWSYGGRLRRSPLAQITL